MNKITQEVLFMPRLKSETLSVKEYIEGEYKVREVVKIIYTESGRPYEIHGRTTRPLHPDPAKVKRVIETATRIAENVERRLAEAEEKARQQASAATE